MSQITQCLWQCLFLIGWEQKYFKTTGSQNWNQIKSGHGLKAGQKFEVCLEDKCLSPAKFVQVSHVCLATASVEYFWSQWSGKYLELVGRNLWGREQFNWQIRPGETQGDLTHPTGRPSFILNFNVETECWSPGQPECFDSTSQGFCNLSPHITIKIYLSRWKWSQKICLSFPKYLF